MIFRWIFQHICIKLPQVMPNILDFAVKNDETSEQHGRKHKQKLYMVMHQQVSTGT